MYNQTIKLPDGDHEILLDDADYEALNKFDYNLETVFLKDFPYVRLWLGGEGTLLHHLVGKRNLHHEFVMGGGEAFYHANGNTFDNRSENIVLGKVKMKGASWDKRVGKWRSQIWLNGKVVHLGHFKTPEEASMEYYKAKDEYKEQRKYKTT